MKSTALKRLFEIQRKFNPELKNVKSYDKKQKITKQFILAVMAEAHEVLNEINWCDWKPKREIITSNICEEVVDTFKFLINVLLIWDIDEDKFLEEFERKSLVVEQRKKQREALELVKKKKSKICALDIDGVIVDFPTCYINFINKELGTKFNTMFDVNKKLSKKQLMDIKDKYRKSGAKQSVGVLPEAKKLITSLKQMGYSIVLLTKRPYKKYLRIFADTKINLDNNGIKYDAILFDSEKHKRIVKEFPKLHFIVEDNKNISNEVGAWGVKSFLIDNIYNQGSLNDNVTRVKALSDIPKILKANGKS